MVGPVHHETRSWKASTPRQASLWQPKQGWFMLLINPLSPYCGWSQASSRRNSSCLVILVLLRGCFCKGTQASPEDAWASRECRVGSPTGVPVGFSHNSLGGTGVVGERSMRWLVSATQLGNLSQHLHFQAFILSVFLLHPVLWAVQFKFSFFFFFFSFPAAHANWSI